MKLFIVPEITFKGHSRSSTMLSFVISPGLSIRDRTSRLRLFSDKSSWNDLECWSRSLAMAQFNKSHITFY